MFDQVFFMANTMAGNSNIPSTFLNPMTGVFFGGVVMAALVVFKTVDYFLEKARAEKEQDNSQKIVDGISDAITNSMDPLTQSVEKMEKQISEIKDKTDKSWELHNKFDEDGRPRWYIPYTLPDVLQQVSHTCERIVASQNETLKAFKETASLQQEILQNQKQFLGALQNFQNQQASLQQGLNLLIQQVMSSKGNTSSEIIPQQSPK